MASLELRDNPQHPEGLTAAQERLMDLLLTRPNNSAKAEIGIRGSDGEYLSIAPGRAIAIAPRGTGFRFVHHQDHPGAPLAPLKVNLRELDQDILTGIAIVLAELQEKAGLHPDLVTGLPNAGVPLARAFADYSGVEYVDIFDKVETPEKRYLVLRNEEARYPGKKLLMVDDLIDQGVTKGFAFALADKLECESVSLSVVFDRGEGGIELLKSQGRTIYYAAKLNDGLKYGIRTGNFSQEAYDAHIQYGDDTRNYISNALRSKT